MKQIVVFYGYKGSGKDTCYEILRDIYFDRKIESMTVGGKIRSLFGKDLQVKTIEKLSFAGKLREIVWDLFKNKIVDKNLLNGSIEQKETPIEGWEVPQDVKDSCGFTETYWTGRRLLQWFGTEVCRNVYRDVWVDAFVDQLKESDEDVICITDCRFRNEYETLKNLDKDEFEVSFIHVDRSTDDNEYSTHASEKDLKTFDCDVRIKNDGSLRELQDEITKLRL